VRLESVVQKPVLIGIWDATPTKGAGIWFTAINAVTGGTEKCLILVVTGFSSVASDVHDFFLSTQLRPPDADGFFSSLPAAKENEVQMSL
jgi:hypothetical protein